MVVNGEWATSQHFAVGEKYKNMKPEIKEVKPLTYEVSEIK